MNGTWRITLSFSAMQSQCIENNRKKVRHVSYANSGVMSGSLQHSRQFLTICTSWVEWRSGYHTDWRALSRPFTTPWCPVCNFLRMSCLIAVEFTMWQSLSNKPFCPDNPAATWWMVLLCQATSCLTILTGKNGQWREGYLLPTWVRKITCQRFDWMLQLSSGRKFETFILMMTRAISRNVSKLFSELKLWEATEILVLMLSDVLQPGFCCRQACVLSNSQKRQHPLEEFDQRSSGQHISDCEALSLNMIWSSSFRISALGLAVHPNCAKERDEGFVICCYTAFEFHR